MQERENAEWTNNNPGNSAVTETLTTPLGVKTKALLVIFHSDDTIAAAQQVLVTSLAQADTAPSSTIFTTSLTGTGGTKFNVTVYVQVRTNTSSAIRWRFGGTSNTDINIIGVVHGWIDTRGKDD